MDQHAAADRLQDGDAISTFSHFSVCASIVAREFGIPAVVGTKNGSHLLTDGQLVEVNGTTGFVTVVEED
jgi:phosphohistidine swiveling domain-containing protein